MPDFTVNNCISHDLQQEIDAARSIGQLREIGLRMPEMVRRAIRSNSDITRVVRQISRFNDSVTLRLIALLESTEGIRLPEGATYLVLGSEGRGEQTLRTDQDSAIVYSDDLSANEIRTVEIFSTRLEDALEEIGVPRCPGNIMAGNPQWCHSVSEWKELLSLWITVPTPDNILHFGTFQDLRPLYGDESYAMTLRDHICSSVQCHGLFFPNMAYHVVRFPSPFTIFGHIRVEQNGAHKGMVNLKKAGIFAITTGTSLLTLEAGAIGGDTWEKLDHLGKLGAFSTDDFETITTSFTFLVRLRLQQQLQDLAAGSTSTNCIDPHHMTGTEHEQFRLALKGVNTFLWLFRSHYLLDYLSM